MADKRLIDASKLLGAFCADCGMREGNCSNSCEKDCAIYDTITSAPTVEAQPVKHGYWIGWNCSVCGKSTTHVGAKWCPVCGAKMRFREI